MNSVKENPWKQFKVADGKEEMNNTRKQKYHKKRSSIRKVTPMRLDNAGEPKPAPTKKEKPIKKNNESASHPTKGDREPSAKRTNDEQRLKFDSKEE